VLEGHRDRLLPEVLRRAGYRTAAVSSNLWITERSGFGTGFDEFIGVETGRQALLHRGDRRSRMRWALEGSGRAPTTVRPRPGACSGA